MCHDPVVVLDTRAARAQTVVFSDGFERTTGSGDGNGNPAGPGNGFSDWGTNGNPFGGTLSAAYLTSASRSGGANQVTGVNQFDATLGSHGHLLNGGAKMGVSVLSASPLGFDVSFDFDRNTDPAADPNAGGFLAVGLGIDPASTLGGLSSIEDTSLGVLFQQPANGNAANGSLVLFNDQANGMTFDYLDPASVHSVFLSIRPQAAGAYGVGDVISYSLAVDGIPIFANETFVADGSDLGVVSFSSNQFTPRYVDNLVITAVVPEPGCLVMLVGGFLALAATRCRFYSK